MVRKYIFCLFFILFICGNIISAEDVRFNAPQNEQLEIFETCRFNGALCDSTFSCNLSIINPEQIEIVSQESMIRSGSFYNRTLTEQNQSINGIYGATVDCGNSSFSGSNTFSYRISPDGSEPVSLGQGLVLVGALLLMMIISFLMAMLGLKSINTTIKLSFISFSVLLLVFGVGFSLNMIKNFLATSPALTANFSTFYVLFVILLSVGGISMILYLIYVAFKAFYASRGLIDE